VQDRLLPIGAVINGVLVTGNTTAVPLFTSLPGYGLFNVRGGFQFNENSNSSSTSRTSLIRPIAIPVGALTALAAASLCVTSTSSDAE
jgi:hypothetical protein